MTQELKRPSIYQFKFGDCLITNILDGYLQRHDFHPFIATNAQASEVEALAKEYRIPFPGMEHNFVVTLIQTQKIGKFPIVLVGTEFWNGMLDWIKKVLLEEHKNISEEDLDLFHIVDTAEEVVEIINTFYNKHLLSPNF